MLLTATYSRQNNGPPKDVYALIPWTCKCVTLCGKRDFAGVIRLRILRWGDNPGLSQWAQCDHEGPYKREAGGSKSEKMMWVRDQHPREWAEEAMLFALKVEGAPQSREFGSPLEAGKGKETNSPLDLLQGMQLCPHLAFSSTRPIFLDFWPQNYKIITLRCSKPLHLW